MNRVRASGCVLRGQGRGAAGFTLLEVLVALLVLSIGLIGVAGLQLLGVSNSRDAYFRTQAVVLSYDIADRMRANQDGVDNGRYDGNTNDTAKTNCRNTTGCSVNDMADDDIALWRAALASLPAGEGIVCIDSSPNDGTGVASAQCDGAGNQYVVKVWWDNDRNAATPKALLSTVFVP
jgi:type IV pilus assembly protein PilV